MEFKSKNNLPFEVADWEHSPNFKRFRIGSCEGLWCSNERAYGILAITNNAPGNGHFEDVMQWFENSCRRDKKSFMFLEVWNKRLKKKLIEKYGFNDIGNDNLQRIF